MVNIFGSPDKRGKSTKTSLRKIAEIKHVNANTIEFMTKKTDNVLTLQEIKNFLLAEKNNAFGMHPKPHANAHVRVDMMRLCISGINIEGVKNQLKCKTFGDRVIFYNPTICRNLIGHEKNKELKAEMTKRFQSLEQLEDRDGYIPS